MSAAQIHRPGGLKVVGFAGGGGSSVAVRMALGEDPDLAMNHWLTAVLAHQRHFPDTDHHCADVFDVDPRDWRPGEPIAFGWFSPDCTDFSKAKGKAPRSARIRGLAWSVIPWALFRRVQVIMLENVEEFAQWGPVYRTGPHVGEPIPERRGETFARWRSRLERMGYQVEWRVLNAADYGAPTTRKRLYVIARCDGQPIVWPEPTHAPRAKAKALGRRPWRGACEVIDFTRPTPSIFLTQDEAKAQGLRVKRPLVKATLGRVARGMERYVIGAAEPFIVPITQRTWGQDRTHGVRDPLRTITSAKGGEFALAAPIVASVAHGDDWRRGGDRVYDVAEPLRALTGTGDKVVASAFLAPRYSERDGQAPRALDVTEPYPTIVPDGNGGSLAVAYLGRQFGSTVSGRDLTEPHPTVMSEGGGGKSQLVAAYMAQGNAERLGRGVDEPVTTLTQRCTQQQLVTAHLGSYYGCGIGSDLAEPARTATGKDRHAVTAAFLEQANTGLVGHDAREPVSTIVGLGSTQRLVEARLALEGGEVGRRAQVLQFMWEHFGEPTAEEWADPLATLAGRLKFGLVVLGGQVWMVVDIGLRMLTPGELAGAMGLPADYHLDVNAFGEPVSKVAQTQMIGNMVSPPPAAAMIRANCPHLVRPEQRAAA